MLKFKKFIELYLHIGLLEKEVLGQLVKFHNIVTNVSFSLWLYLSQLKIAKDAGIFIHIVSLRWLTPKMQK